MPRIRAGQGGQSLISVARWPLPAASLGAVVGEERFKQSHNTSKAAWCSRGPAVAAVEGCMPGVEEGIVSGHRDAEAGEVGSGAERSLKALADRTCPPGSVCV